MKQAYKLGSVLVAGVALGVAGGSAIHAQQAKVAPGFVIFEVEVNDAATFQKYSSAVPGTLAPFNARFVVRGGKVTPVEGEPPKGRFGVIQFASAEQALAWENSPEYEAIKPIRHNSANSRIFIVEGVAPQ